MRVSTLILSVLLLVTVVQADAFAAGSAREATLDPDHNTIVGRTVTIRSGFAGQPLVEPHVSCHPTDSDHLLVAAMVVTDTARPYESCRLSSFVSTDGGQTWAETAHDWWGYDPWTAILADGEAVMSWLGTRGSFQHRFPVQFFSSEDGGRTWRDAVQTLPGAHDGTKLVARGNDCYFTTVRFRDHAGADVVLCRRGENGRFAEVARIDGKGQRLNFCEPALLSDGTVLVPASHFLRDIWVQAFHHATRELSEPTIVSRKPGGNRGYMRLAADSGAKSPHRDHAYFVRAVATGRSQRGVLLNTSSDRGATWTPDTRIDLFESATTSKALVASVAVNADGVVGVSWVDVHDDPEGAAYDVYFAISCDGGESFQRPRRITSGSSNPKTAGNADVANKFPGGGHYLGLAGRADGSFQLVWSDSRSGVFELQTCNVSLQP